MRTCAALAAGDEVEKLFRKDAGDFFACRFDGVPQQVAAHEQCTVGLLQLEPFLAGKTGALEADTVEPAHAVDAANDGERRQVEADPGAALHHRHGADSAELVHDGVAGEECAVADHCMAANQYAVGKDRLVADDGVVTNVAIGHEYVFRADDGVFLERVGTVNGDVFTERVLLTDNQPSGGSVVFHVLRGIADNAAGMKAVAATDSGVPREMHMRPDDAVGAERDVRVDDGVRADLSAVVNLCVFVDDGCGVNHS